MLGDGECSIVSYLYFLAKQNEHDTIQQDGQAIWKSHSIKAHQYVHIFEAPTFSNVSTEFDLDMTCSF